MMPYDPPFITTLLRRMPAEQLATVTSRSFQKWPLAVCTRGETIRELISNERARRK